MCLEPALHDKRSQHNEKPVPGDKESPSHTATRESSPAARESAQPKMNGFLIHYIKNKENHNLNEKRQSTDTKKDEFDAENYLIRI